MSRVEPPEPSTLDAATADLLALAVGPDGAPLGTVAALGHCPALLGPFLGWAAALALQGSLSHRQHEIAALRAAFWCRSAFEWSEHCGYARPAGLDDDDIARLGLPAATPGWSDAERALVRVVDELVVHRKVDDASWRALAGHLSEAQLVELLYVIGQYTMLSLVANALELPATPGEAALPPPIAG